MRRFVVKVDQEIVGEGVEWRSGEVAYFSLRTGPYTFADMQDLHDTADWAALQKQHRVLWLDPHPDKADSTGETNEPPAG